MVYTNNISCKYFETKEKLTNMQMRWQGFLARFDYEIVYKPGKLNVVADALSWKEQFLGVIQLVKGIFKVDSDWPKIIQAAYKDDCQAQKGIKQFCRC